MRFRHRLAAQFCSAVVLLYALFGLGVSSPVSAGAPPATPNSKTAPDNSGIATMPRVAVEIQNINDNAALQATGASGANLARVVISWAGAEPTRTNPPTYNLGTAEYTINQAVNHNLTPLIIILDCPVWACVGSDGPLYGGMENAAAQFMGAIATRFGHAPYNVHYWEMWNEPDSTGGSIPQAGCPANNRNWGCHPAQYAQMLAAVYPAVKSADPLSVVMLGGMAYDNWFNQGGPFNPDFLPGVLDSGGGQYIDAVAFHYYTNNGHGWTNLGVKATELRTVLQQHGSPNLALVTTESGLPSDPAFGSSEQIQARYLAQMYTHGAAAGITSMVWYLNKDTPNPNPGQEVFASDGLLRTNNSPKLSYTAMQVFAREVGSSPYQYRLGPNDGVTGLLEGYRFRSASVIWNNEASTAVLEIPAAQAAAIVRAVDLYGQPVELRQGTGGTKLVNVGLDPIYVEWQTSRFTDVPLDFWAYSYIEYLASRSIVGGYPCGAAGEPCDALNSPYFRPGNTATRGQFSKMTVLGMGWSPLNPADPHFQDVPADSPFYTFIETAFSHGALGGYACGTPPDEPCIAPQNKPYFRPANNVSRGQIAKILVLAKGWPLLNPENPTFPDVPVGSPFYQHVETAVAHGVVSGYSNGTFGPANSATRAQLSKMLALTIQQP